MPKGTAFVEDSFFTDQDGGEGWFGDELSTVGSPASVIPLLI